MDFVEPEHFPHVFCLNTQHRDGYLWDRLFQSHCQKHVPEQPGLCSEEEDLRGKHQLSSVWWLGRQTTAVSEYVEMRAFVGITSLLPQNPTATETTSCISFLKALPTSQVLSEKWLLSHPPRLRGKSRLNVCIFPQKKCETHTTENHFFS